MGLVGYEPYLTNPLRMNSRGYDLHDLLVIRNVTDF